MAEAEKKAKGAELAQQAVMSKAAAAKLELLIMQDEEPKDPLARLETANTEESKSETLSNPPKSPRENLSSSQVKKKEKRKNRNKKK